jgi:outer membrane receptor protein involved in Fe transport
LPNGGGYTICGLYDITPTKFGQVDNVITRSKNFGEQSQVFDGVDISVNARLPRGVLIQGGTSTGRTRTNRCFAVDSPQQLLFCDVRPPFLTQIKVLGIYPLPWWGLQTSATYQSLPGPEITASYAAPLAQIAPSLRRNLAGGARSATVPLVSPGTLYGERLHQIDLRIAKNIRKGAYRIQPQVDFYNLLNANPVFLVNNTYGANWQRPTAVLSGRLVKFGVQFDF